MKSIKCRKNKSEGGIERKNGGNDEGKFAIVEELPNTRNNKNYEAVVLTVYLIYRST